MKKIYEKSQLYFALIWSGVYVVLMSAADSVSETIGTAKIVTAPVCIGLVLAMYLWIRRNGLREQYGLCPFGGSAKQYLFFIPLVLLASTNLWWGVRLNYTPAESVLYVVSMLCVGFLEEVIFRGFLFKALCRTNVKRAVAISSVTFGIGPIVNLLNGRDIPETMMQICYAVAVGFLFTSLFLRGKSLWPCILTHSAINSPSAFANDGGAPAWHGIAGSAFLCLVSLAYVVYILRVTKKQEPILDE